MAEQLQLVDLDVGSFGGALSLLKVFPKTSDRGGYASDSEEEYEYGVILRNVGRSYQNVGRPVYVIIEETDGSSRRRSGLDWESDGWASCRGLQT